MTLAERLRQEDRAEGRIKGRIEGRMKGRMEGEKRARLEMAQAMLDKNIAPDIIMEMTRLTHSELATITR